MAFLADDAMFEAPRGPARCGTRFTGKATVHEGMAGRFTGVRGCDPREFQGGLIVRMDSCWKIVP